MILPNFFLISIAFVKKIFIISNCICIQMFSVLCHHLELKMVFITDLRYITVLKNALNFSLYTIKSLESKYFWGGYNA